MAESFGWCPEAFVGIVQVITEIFWRWCGGRYASLDFFTQTFFITKN